MRIMFLTPFVGPGSLSVRPLELGRALTRRGHAVTVVGLGLAGSRRGSTRDIDGVRVVATPRLWGARWLGYDALPWDLVARTWRTLRESHDVVVSYGPFLRTDAPARLARALGKARIVVHDLDELWTSEGAPAGFGDPPDARLDRRVGKIHERTDGLIVISEALQGFAMERGMEASRVMRIPVSAPPRRNGEGSKERAREILGLGRDLPILLHGAGAIPKEDLSVLLATVERLDASGHDFELLVSGHAAGSVEAAAVSRGMGHRVRACGFVSSEMHAALLQAADVALLPYPDRPWNRYRFPWRLGEYLRAGLPVASQDVGEVGRTLRRGGGRLASADSPDLFAPTVELLSNAHERAQAARDARAIAATEFDPDLHAAQLEAFFVRLLREQGRLMGVA